MIKSMGKTRSILQTKYTQLRQTILLRMQNRRFWRDSILLMLANAIVVALGLVRTPLMTWMLPKSEVGMLGVVASWLPFVQLLSLPGLDNATYHYVAKGKPAAFFVNLLYRIRWSLLSSLCFISGAIYWYWRGDVPLAWMFIITGISYPVTIGMTASAGMLGAQERYKGLFWYRIFESLTDFTGFIPLAFSAWWISRVVTFYSGNQLATAIQQAGASFFLAWQMKRLGVPRLPKEDEKELVRYGKHLTAIAGIGAFQARTDALLVGAILSLETMADYSIALILYEQFRRLWNVYLTIRYPPLVKLPVARRRYRMIREGTVVWLGFTGLGFFISILVHILVPIILPSSYNKSASYMDWLITIFVVSIPGFFAETYFRTEQNEKRQYLMRIAAAIVGVAAPALLVFRWGAYGALAGRLVASIILSLFGIWLFFKDKPQALSG